MKTYIYKSPAKINLFLHIINKRADGYHNLESIMVLLDYYDKINISIRNDNKIIRISGNENINYEDDLIIKSAKLLQNNSKTNLGVNISINKNIPIGGGLGGGSSNAATVLLALNKLWNINYSINKLQQLSLNLGADVPFFIKEKNAFISGIGEKITAINIDSRYYLVVCLCEQFSTKKIFSHKLLTKSKVIGKMPNFLEALQLGNDCLSVVKKVNNKITSVMNDLNAVKNKLCDAKLSGSGGCMFVVFADKKDAKIALQIFKHKEGIKSFIAKSKN